MAREKPLNKIITYIKNTLVFKDNITIVYTNNNYKLGIK